MTSNLFACEPPGTQERFDTPLECPGAVLKRIVSPAGFTSEPFVQEVDEWVVLLEGNALLEVAGKEVRIAKGEPLFIPAGTPHKILKTSAEPLCFWPALYLPASGGEPV